MKSPILGEISDVLITPVNLLRGKAQDGAVEIDVVTAGEFRIKPDFTEYAVCHEEDADQRVEEDLHSGAKIIIGRYDRRDLRAKGVVEFVERDHETSSCCSLHHT
jgi:hypothetical protein